MFIRERPVWLVYSVALGAVGVATLLRWALHPIVGIGMPFVLLFPAITFAAWLGGFFPGLFATIVGGVVAEYGFADVSRSVVPIHAAHLVRLCFVTISGAVVSLLCEGFRRESRRARSLMDLATRRADESRMAQVEMAQSEALYRGIGESINYGVWVCDAKGNNLYTSESFLKLLGITQEYVSRLGWLEYLHPDDKQRVADGWKACVANQNNWDMEMRFRSSEGSWHPVIARGIPIRDKSGTVTKWAGITLDIRELREVENAYRETAERFRVAVKSLPVTLFNLDRDLRYQWILHPPGGESAERIVGRRDDELGPPGSRDALIAFKRSILTTGVGGRAVVPMDLPQGRRWYDVTAEPARDASGDIIGLTVAAIDVTARKLEEVELERAKEAAEAASRAKDQFLAVLSHELRTPLTPVVATAQMLADDTSVPDHLREPIDLIRRNAELEAKLIDDLLDLTRITRGTLQLRLEQVDAHLALSDAIKMCQVDLTSKNLTLDVNLNAQIAQVNADGARLRQVMWNLLKNAVKFTPDAGHIRLTTLNGDAGDWTLVVQDNGIGISLQALPRVFDAFEQQQRRPDAGLGGLGLGLAISRSLVRQQGGSLTAHSDGLGQGSTFTLSFPVFSPNAVAQDPLPLPQLTQQRTISPAPFQAQPRTAHILLVEDHPDTAVAMQRLLARFGYNVTPAATVAAALDVLRNTVPNRFDLIISDIGLPDGTGMDLVQTLHRDLFIPAIALSGFGMEADIQRAIKAGFSAHLTKPINIRQLEETIRKILAGCAASPDPDPQQTTTAN